MNNLVNGICFYDDETYITLMVSSDNLFWGSCEREEIEN